MTSTKDVFQKMIQRERRIRLVAVFALLILFFSIITMIDNMLISCLIAFVINYLLSPLVNYLERRGFSRKIGNTILFTLVFLLLVVLVSLISPLITDQVQTLRADLPKYIQGTTNLIASFDTKLQELFGGMISFDLGQSVESVLVSWSKATFVDLPNILSHSLTILLLAPFLAFFMLLDGREVSNKFLSIAPNNWFELALNLKHEINIQIGGFIRARLLEALIVGGLVWLGLVLIGFPYSHLLAIFAAAANLIPYVGPFIAAIPALIVAWINAYTGVDLFLVISVYLFAQVVDIAIIIPIVVARIVNLHPVLVVISIIIGSQLMGVLGMLISIPIASTIKVTSIIIYQHLTKFRA